MSLRAAAAARPVRQSNHRTRQPGNRRPLARKRAVPSISSMCGGSGCMPPVPVLHVGAPGSVWLNRPPEWTPRAPPPDGCRSSLALRLHPARHCSHLLAAAGMSGSLNSTIFINGFSFCIPETSRSSLGSSNRPPPARHFSRVSLSLSPKVQEEPSTSVHTTARSPGQSSRARDRNHVFLHPVLRPLRLLRSLDRRQTEVRGRGLPQEACLPQAGRLRQSLLEVLRKPYVSPWSLSRLRPLTLYQTPAAYHSQQQTALTARLRVSQAIDSAPST